MSTEANGGGTAPPPLFTAVVEHIAGAAPELSPRHARIEERDWVVVVVNDRYEARFTTNGVMWCAGVVTRGGGDVWRENQGNLATGVSHLSEDVGGIGGAIIRVVGERRAELFRESNELDFKAAVSARVNESDPTLDAEVYSASPGIYSILVRLAANKAAIIGDVDISWGGQVLTLADGEFTYAEDEEGLCPLTGAPEINYYEPIPAEADGLVASEILRAAGAYRESHPEQDSAVSEYFLLARDVPNPDTSGGESHPWLAAERFERAARFVISRERGRPPRLYPAGGFGAHHVEPDSPVYKALRPHLQPAFPTLTELLVEEKADPLAIIEEMVGAGFFTRDDVVQMMRHLETRAPESRTEA